MDALKPFIENLFKPMPRVVETPFSTEQKREFISKGFSIVKMDDLTAHDLLRLLGEENRIQRINIPEKDYKLLESKKPSYRWVAIDTKILEKKRINEGEWKEKTLPEWIAELAKNSLQYTEGIKNVQSILPDFPTALSLLRNSLYSYVYQTFRNADEEIYPGWSLVSKEGVTISPAIIEDEKLFGNPMPKWELHLLNPYVGYRKVLPVIVPQSASGRL